MSDNIVLIGMMGSGKTAVGQKLAKIMGKKFVDMDTLIESKSGMAITEIFDTKGEQVFRDLESAICDELTTYSNHIISTGGGVILREKNTTTLKQVGKVVYLNTSAEVVFSRLKNSTDRPLLRTLNLESKITQILNNRLQLYTDAADIVVNTDGLSIEQVAQTIVSAIVG